MCIESVSNTDSPTIIKNSKKKRERMTSSLTKLKSSIIEKGNQKNEENEDEPAIIEGLYGTKGFYFQVRKKKRRIKKNFNFLFDYFL